MAKRILSLVLSVALLLGCVSGLALISGAANTVKALPNPSSGTISQKDGFSVIAWETSGAAQWDTGVIANALGLTADDVVDITITLDYFWTGENNPWWHFNTYDKDGGNAPNAEGTNPHDNGFGHFNQYQITTSGQWATWSYSRTEQALNKGEHDFRINIGDIQGSKFYIRGIKFEAVKGEDTYTALWGTYQLAKLDFSSGEIVGTNASVGYNHPNEDDGDAGNGIYEAVAESGVYGIKMNRHNAGFGMNFGDIGLNGEDVAVVVEYYMPSTSSDNTRFRMSINSTDYVMRAGGNGTNANTGALTKDAWAIYTYVLSGDAAAYFVGGATVNTHCWTGAEGDVYYIKSVTVMPASLLADAPADPGYKYYDFEETYAPNPFYPDTTVAKAYGIELVAADQAYFKVASDKADIGLKIYMKDDSTLEQMMIDYQTKTQEEVPDGWRGTNDVTVDIVDGVASYVFDNAVFQNGLNGNGSFRISNERVANVARVEVYELQDKTALNEAIAAAKAVDTTGKTSYTIADLNAAIANAEAVAANEWATANDIAAATTAMTDAAAALKAIPEVGYGSTLGHIAFDHFEGSYQNEGANIGFTDQGEWFEYEVNVTTAGLYDINIDMATGNAASTIEVQDGNGNVYGSFVVPQAGWGDYNTYTVSTPLNAGVQKIRILYKESSANYRGLTLADGRYDLTNVSEFQSDWGKNGEIVLYDGAYAFKFNTDGDGNNKGLSLGGYNNVLSESATIIYEIEAQFEQQANSFTVWYGQGQDDPETDGNEGQSSNTFAASVDATGAWFTYTHTVENYNDGGNYAGTPLTMFGHPGADGNNLYIRSFKAYDAEDPTKEVSIVFAQLGDKSELQAAVEAEITDLSAYTTASAAAYTAALNAAKAVLADDLATQEAVDNALAALNAATDGLAEIINYSSMSFENDQVNNVNSVINHNHPDEDDQDADNGIYEVAADSGIYGIKLSQQNRGFGYGVRNAADWLGEGKQVRMTVSYYAPSAVVQDNSRIGINVDGGWYRVRVGEVTDANTIASQNFVKTGMTKDAVDTFSFVLSEADAAKVLANCNINFYFWNYNDDAATGGDYIYITDIVIDAVPDKSALEEAVNGFDPSIYSAASVEEFNKVLDEAKAVLADASATQAEVDEAVAAIEAAKANLVQVVFEMPDPNWSNKDEATNPMFSTFEEKTVLSWTGTGAFSWNGGVIWSAMGLTEAQIVDLKITTSVYWQGQGGDWWHFNTVNEDGTSAPSLSGTPNDNGFGTFIDYGMASNGWSNVVISRENQQFNNSVDNLYINVGGLAAGNAVYIGGIIYEVTLEDGTVLTAIWGSPITVNKDALNAAIADEVTDLSGYTEESATAYTEALNAAKEVAANADATQEEVDAAAQALVDAKANLVVYAPDLVVESITTTGGDVPKVGDKVAFVITVKNIGNAPVAEGGKYGAIIKINDVLIGWSDNYKSVDTAPVLNPGETIELTTCGGPDGADGTWTVVEGEFTVYAMVNDNPTDGIVEGDSTNNELTITMKSTTLDLAAINAAIADVEALEGLDEYTEESVAALNEALVAAKAAVAKADATQDEIDAAKAALDAAKAALEKKGDDGLLGDVNGDGVINTSDAREILKYAAEVTTEIDESVADVTGDGKVNTSDAREILKYAAEIITEFPAAAK